jgi:hypothetical protein
LSAPSGRELGHTRVVDLGCP